MKRSSELLFYLIIIYILIAGGWWSFLLHSKNQEAKNARLENIRYRLKSDGVENISQHPEFKDIQRYYRRQEAMIIGEGSVFMLLLLLGLWRIYQIRRKELKLALQQQNFLLSITHELKLPIASVQLVLETIKKRQLSTEQLQKLTENGLKDNERLHKLVQDLLLAARVEGGYEYSFTEIDLRELLFDCVDWIQPKYNGQIVFEAAEPIILKKGDQSTLQSAFVNLLENAVKYNDGQEDIVVKLYRKKEQIIIEIQDHGIGIPKGERNRIFNKFYRIGNEDTRKTKGTGLGLYIVQKVIEAHGGSIFAKENQPKGSIFVVQF